MVFSKMFSCVTQRIIAIKFGNKREIQEAKRNVREDIEPKVTFEE